MSRWKSEELLGAVVGEQSFAAACDGARWIGFAGQAGLCLLFIYKNIKK